jgi:hypothetical protein
MSIVDKPMDTYYGVVVAWDLVGWQQWARTAKMFVFWSVENILKLDLDDGCTTINSLKKLYSSNGPLLWYVNCTLMKL